jgi:hypothetical protein
MSAFLDNFQPDPELPDIRRIWRTAKPLLRDAVAAYAPYDPEYPKLKVSKSPGTSNDPSCASALVISTDIDVMLYSHTDTFGSVQERAWNFILDHHELVEAALRRKLFAQHSRSLMEFREEALPPQLQKYWKTIESRVNWDDPSAVDHLFKLVAIGLADNGLDECGFSSFEFQTGWDRDHGLGILMHKDRVLAAAGMTELIGSDSIVDVVKSIQGYGMDDGDLSLLDS